MKLQIICMLFILLSAATRNFCAFTIQRDVQKDLASLETYKAETTGLQALLGRPKRHVSHIALCRYCWDCCGNKGFGYCCQT
ncbi:hepcidin-like [Crotalus tigris]|uniref:hepcidin-like n=1 Tax=Crotalus tigris TaxID=88082 RepID=UPI00192F1590|nr:hepcidin-like [Crotalus tigris]